MKTKIALLAIAVASLTGAHALAVDAPIKGDYEVGVSGSYSRFSASGEDISVLNGEISYGYFQTDQLEWLGSLGYSEVDLLGDSVDATILSGGVRYHGEASDSYQPFVGANLSYYDILSEDDWGWDVQIGLKQLVSDSASIDWTVSYGETDEFEIETLSVAVGVSLRF